MGLCASGSRGLKLIFVFWLLRYRLLIYGLEGLHFMAVCIRRISLGFNLTSRTLLDFVRLTEYEKHKLLILPVHPANLCEGQSVCTKPLNEDSSTWLRSRSELRGVPSSPRLKSPLQLASHSGVHVDLKVLLFHLFPQSLLTVYRWFIFQVTSLSHNVSFSCI